MKQKIKHWWFANHLVFTFALILIVIFLYLSNPRFNTSEFLMSAIGGILAISYFCFQHSLIEARFSRELFSEFNSRYNKLNDSLYDIVSDNRQLTDSDKKTLVDYFNLSAEEWLYFESGIIPPKVWISWNNGMKIYYKVDKIGVFWLEELKSNSYYGFSAKLLVSEKRPSL